MKRCFLLLVLILTCSISIVMGNAFDIRVLEDRGSSITIEFTVKNYEVEPIEINGHPCSRVIVPGYTVTFLKKGYPELPRFARSIIIPDDGRMKFRILDVKYETVKIDPVIPSKGNLKRNIDPASVPYTWSDFYKKNVWFPRQHIELSSPYILRDFRGQTVRFNPFQYNPARGELRVMKHVVIEVYKAGSGGENVLVRKDNTISKAFEEIYKNFFLNFSSVPTRYPFLYDTVGNMLIIAADGYYDNMASFVDWKKRKGIPVEIDSVSSIGNNSTAIKNYIQNKYNTDGVTWVLLVGNATDVATIAGSFDETCDPVYAYLAGGDNYLDAFISRFSANAEVDVDNQVARSVKYERYPEDGGIWYYKGIVTATSEGTPADSERANWVRDTMLAYTYTEVTKVYEPWGTDAMITNAINEGRSLLNHIGHGTETGFGTQTAFWFDINDIAALSNTDMLPFVFLVACLTGDFDAVTTCCCEAWMWDGTPAAPQGAIAAYGASVLQSWVPPTHAQLHANGLLKREEAVTVGGMAYNGAMYMLDVDGDLEMLETWHIFGDASIDLRTDIPDTFEVTHPSIVDLGPTTFTVTVKDNDGVTPIQDALVCLWIYTQSPELHTAGYTDAGGQITFNISPANAGDTMWVTVTKHNYKPYEGYALVASGAPSKPVLYNLFDFARDYTLTPTVTFSSTDNEGDQIEYRIFWDTDPSFGSPDSATTGLYVSGATGSYTFGSLIDGETYYWKVKGRDPLGSNYWGPFSDVRSFTIGVSLPPLTCTWYQTKGEQFNSDILIDVTVQGDSVILPSAGSTITDTLINEDFEAGGLPAGWSVVDGDGDGYTWYVTTTGKADLNGNDPPGAGSYYAYYSDDDAGSGNTTADEYLITPGKYTGNSDSLRLNYGWGFRLYQSGEQMTTEVRFHDGVSWGSWSIVATHSATGSGTDNINLTPYLPADSVQVRWHYDDGGNWGWASAVDNVLLIRKYSLTNTDGTITGIPVVFDALNNVYARSSWGDVIWEKSLAGDSISIQVEYLSSGVWSLVPDADIPGNSGGIFTVTVSGTLSINNLAPATYDTIRVVAHLYRPGGKASSDPSLLSWEVGNLGRYLSIYLTAFEATSGRGYVRLYWRTESERDNAYWIIERTGDLGSGWDRIGVISGQGTKPTPTEYSYKDKGIGKDGMYYYQITSVDGNGNRETFGPVSVKVLGNIPCIFALHKVYPNPFSKGLTIRYDIPDVSNVSLEVYNVSGQVVRVLVNGRVEAGYHSIQWDGRNERGKGLGYGIYFLRMEAGGFRKTEKLLFIK